MTHANPAVWGRGTWVLLHCMTMRYPVRPEPHHRQEMLSFLHAMAAVLPCRACRFHMRHYMRTNPPFLDSRCSFVRWMIAFHNHVNDRLGKPIVPYEEARTAVDRMCHQ